MSFTGYCGKFERASDTPWSMDRSSIVRPRLQQSPRKRQRPHFCETAVLKGRLNTCGCERHMVKMLKPFSSETYLQKEKRIAGRTTYLINLPRSAIGFSFYKPVSERNGLNTLRRCVDLQPRLGLISPLRAMEQLDAFFSRNSSVKVTGHLGNM